MSSSHRGGQDGSKSTQKSRITKKAKLPLLEPPSCFAVVESGLYRSEVFSKKHFPFIATLHLKTALLLSVEAPSRALKVFLKDNKTRLVHLGLSLWSDDESWEPVTPHLAKEALELILNLERAPLLIMCSGGIHETGTIVACLRRLQGWTMCSILVEYHLFAGSRARFFNEQFAEFFDVDLVNLPRYPCGWFQGQLQLDMLEKEEKKQWETHLTTRTAVGNEAFIVTEPGHQSTHLPEKSKGQKGHSEGGQKGEQTDTSSATQHTPGDLPTANMGQGEAAANSSATPRSPEELKVEPGYFYHTDFGLKLVSDGAKFSRKKSLIGISD